MFNINRRVAERISLGIKKFQPVLASAKTRDINESDTVTIITDMLSDIFGFDKYSEITSEFSIRNTYCDLAIKLEGKPALLIEVKAIGLELKDVYVKQAVDYASNQGIDWVVLTNGMLWKVFKVTFTKPIGQELVLDLDFSNLNFKSPDNIEQLFLLSKEGLIKQHLEDFHIQKQTLSRFFIAALIQSDCILDVLRKELKKISPDVRIDIDQVKAVVVNEVIKRDALEGDKADEAKKRIIRIQNKNKVKVKTPPKNIILAEIQNDMPENP